MANLAFGAGDRDLRAGLERSPCAFGADDRRHTQFARHDCRMTGSAAAFRHDRGGNLHDRLPIRGGRIPQPERRPV